MNRDNYIWTLPKGTVVKSPEHSYMIQEVLGQGGFGITYKVIDENNQVLALKEHFMRRHCERKDDMVTMDFNAAAAREVKDSLKEFKREGRLLKEISDQCPNIVSVNEVFEANNTAYYSMEYLGGGSLRDLVRKIGGPLDEEEAKAIMMPIAEALTYLHSQKILHMDIKPDNIVMRVNPDDDTPTPVLIDFGVSLHFDDKDKLTTTHHIAGVTRGFSPIEQYDPIERFAPTVDIYALAATWFYLLAGHNPKAATEIKKKDILQSLPDNVSDYVRNAIIEGMKFSYEERPQTVKDFLRLIEGKTPPTPPPPPGGKDRGDNDTQDINKFHRLKRLAIAACILAAMAAGVTWGVKSCGEQGKGGGGKLPPDSIENPLTKYYKASGKMETNNGDSAKVELYLKVIDDSVSGICHYMGKDSALVVKGIVKKNGFDLTEMNKSGQDVAGRYWGQSLTKDIDTGNAIYKGNYIPEKNDGRYDFNFTVEEIDSINIPDIPLAQSIKQVVDKKKDKQTTKEQTTKEQTTKEQTAKEQTTKEQTTSNEGDTPPKTEKGKTTSNTPESKPTETPPPATDPFRTKVDSLLRH